MRASLALALALLVAPALAGGSPPASRAVAAAPQAVIRMELTEQEARDLQAALDAAIRASGYSRMSLAALGLGSKLERAAAEATKLPAPK